MATGGGFVTTAFSEKMIVLIRINIFWKYWSSQKMYHHDTLLEWWEIGKFRIKEIIQGHGKEKSRKQNQKHDVLQKQYISLINDPEK